MAVPYSPKDERTRCASRNGPLWLNRAASADEEALNLDEYDMPLIDSHRSAAMTTIPSQLRAFHAAVRTGSIRKASEELGLAPSSVSRQIAILEREMGTALFDRRASGVALTHAGTLVADYATGVLMDYDTLRTDLNDIRGVQRRLIRIALVESAAWIGPVRAIARFRASFPTVSFSVRLMPAPRVAEAVQQGQCDVGLAFCIEPDSSIVTLGSVAEPIVLAVPAAHSLAEATRVALLDLKGVPLALPDVDFGVRRIIDRAAAVGGFRLSPTLSSNVFDILLEFVRRDLGVAILPMRAIREVGREDVAVVRLSDDALQNTTIDVVVLRKRRLPRVVKKFVDMLISEIAVPG